MTFGTGWGVDPLDSASVLEKNPVRGGAPVAGKSQILAGSNGVQGPPSKSVPGILIDVLDLCEKKTSRSWLDGGRCSFLSRR